MVFPLSGVPESITIGGTIMSTTTMSRAINDQIINKIGDYLSGKVTSTEFNLSRLNNDYLLLIYRHGRITYPGRKLQILDELRNEIKRRKLRH